MICPLCKKDWKEREIHESHRVPCYMFKGVTHAERKNQADKFGRDNICFICHDKYEDYIRSKIIPIVVELSKEYFKECDKNGNTNT